MRKSALALAVGGLLATMAATAEPAMARHLWSEEYGWRTDHHRPSRVVVVRPDGERTIIRRTPHGRRITTIHADGSRTVRFERRGPPRPVYVYP
jgi:hypothetical protein